MNQILIVIPFHKADAPMAERLIDWIYCLHGNKSNGHVLLAAAHDVHQEMVDKIKVSADVAFDSFDAIRVPAAPGRTKDEAVNWMFKGIAGHVAKTYRVPFFWCEPDLTPTDEKWLWGLASAYYSQPKRYCGNIMRMTSKAGDVLFPARCIIYPPDAVNDLGQHCNSPAPFNYSASGMVMHTTRSRLVMEKVIANSDDLLNIGRDVIAVHSDKSGLALNEAEARLSAKARNLVAPIHSAAGQNLTKTTP